MTLIICIHNNDYWKENIKHIGLAIKSNKQENPFLTHFGDMRPLAISFYSTHNNNTLKGFWGNTFHLLYEPKLLFII